MYIFPVTEGAFSVGIPFKYSEKYDKYDGYYVKKKYDNFSDEIAEYDSHNFSYMIFKNEVLTKAKQYMDTELIKSIPGADVDWYGVSVGNKISLEHIISIILYCDYTNLSSDFSASHRKSSPFELLSMTKQRNGKYWWWSYLLLQTIQNYGINNMNNRGPLKGPFYTGMSFIMSVPEFNIQLFSPTSTSVQIQVAIKFSGQQGIILEFYNSDTYRSQLVKAFDVSSISRYREEDERYYMFFCCCATFYLLFFYPYY